MLNERKEKGITITQITTSIGKRVGISPSEKSTIVSLDDEDDVIVIEPPVKKSKGKKKATGKKK